MKKVCKMCGKKFIQKQWNQIYCGSKTKNNGCSSINRKNLLRRYAKTEKMKLYHRNYDKIWHKSQRKLDTKYNQRQKVAKRIFSHSKEARLKNKKWRDNNLPKILEFNRKRSILKKGIIGFHTNNEWRDLKQKADYCCVICGISEKELSIKWIGTNFTKLTRDHKKPVSKGGTDYIKNIQPLCISCNASKKDKEYEK